MGKKQLAVAILAYHTLSIKDQDRIYKEIFWNTDLAYNYKVRKSSIFSRLSINRNFYINHTKCGIGVSTYLFLQELASSFENNKIYPYGIGLNFEVSLNKKSNTNSDGI